MKYIKVSWLHNLPQEPIDLYSEIDMDGWERRKVEVFRDGSKNYASAGHATGSSQLSETPIPSIQEISLDPQFRPKEILAEEFETVWLEATAA